MKNVLSLCLFSVFSTLPALAAEVSSKKFRLEHIDSAIKLQAFKNSCPYITEDILEEGYQSLPEEWELSSGVSQLLKQNPVWGMWLIIYENNVVGRITLYKPTAINERSEIFTWIQPQYRGSHIGRDARHQLYKHLLPFVGNPVTIGEVQMSRPNLLKITHIANFRGVLAEIAIDNYASLISELRSGARVFDYVGEEERVSMVRLYYPAKDISAEKLQLDKRLHALKMVVEPAIVNNKTRDEAILMLKSLERGKRIEDLPAQFELSR